MKKVHITTLGCSKNVVDSEVLLGRLLEEGHVHTEAPEDAEVIVINTCGFIEDAKKESIQAIFEAVDLKKKDKDKKVIISGCLSQRYHEELKNEIPEADAIFGTEDYDRILDAIGKSHSAAVNHNLIRKLTTPSHFAYLKIAEGCDHSCSFCAIPGIRGKYRSRKIEDIVQEAKFLVDQGVREIIIISQDTSYYGVDLYGKQKILTLIDEISRIDKLRWLRLLYWYPSNFPLELIHMMKSHQKLVPYLDLPMQHISASLLKNMRRAGTRSKLLKIFNTAREVVPEIALRTTMILGHPGETDDDFQDLYDFVKEIRFDRLGTFLYSDEDNTFAYNYNGKIKPEVAAERQNRIMELQKDISLTENQKLIGETFEVLFDEQDKNSNMSIGRTYKDAPEIDNEVLVTGNAGASPAPGEFRNVIIEDASEYELYGKLTVK